jgi:hypothetical protein
MGQAVTSVHRIGVRTRCLDDIGVVREGHFALL